MHLYLRCDRVSVRLHPWTAQICSVTSCRCGTRSVTFCVQLADKYGKEKSHNTGHFVEICRALSKFITPMVLSVSCDHVNRRSLSCRCFCSAIRKKFPNVINLVSLTKYLRLLLKLGSLPSSRISLLFLLVCRTDTRCRRRSSSSWTPRLRSQPRR